MQNKLFVRNLSFNCVDDQLQQLFAQFGDVTSVNVVKDRDTGRSRGFAFVEMATQQQAETAMRSLEGTELDGRTLHVAIAEQRDRRPNGSGGRRR